MSSADQLTLAYGEEASFGGALISPTLKELRITGEGLKQQQTFTPSAEIRGDRQLSDVIRTDASGVGDIPFEFSYGTYDDLLEAALCSAGWSSPVTVGPSSTISADDSDNSFSDSADGFTNLAVGQWIKTSGFANAANNSYFKIISKPSNGKIIVKGGIGKLVTEAAGPNVTITMGAQIVNGSEFRSFKLEKAFTDLNNQFAVYDGYAIDSLSGTINADAILTGTLGWIGKGERSESSTIGDGSNTPAPTNDVMAAVDDILAVLEGDYDAFDATQFTFQYSNNLRARKKIGLLGPMSLGMGTISLTGSLVVYFEDESLIDKYLNDESSAVAVIAEDAAGNAYVFDIPRIRYTDGERLAGGQNTDIMAEMQWMAMRHPTEDITFRIVRFPA